MKIVTVWESKIFENGIELGDMILGLPDGAEEIKLEVEGESIRVTYCIKVMKRDKSKR